MAWGSSKPKAPPPPKSAFITLLPLFFLLIILGIAAFIGYHLYLASLKISDAATEKMQKNNLVFTKDGLKVGVKEVKNESYVDQTQSFLVKAWNLSTWPEYKSRLWNKDNPTAAASGSDKRKAYSRSSSNTK